MYSGKCTRPGIKEMNINYDNKDSFDFVQSLYEKGVQEIRQYIKGIGADKFHYFRLYQGGKYFLFSDDIKFSESVIFRCHENSPIYMKVIQSLPENEPHLYISPSLFNTSDPVIMLLNELGWQNHCIIYCRHKDYVDCLSILSSSENDFYIQFCINNSLLIKNLYWFVREKIISLVNFKKKDIFAHFRNGADISFKEKNPLQGLRSMQNRIEHSFEERTRQKLSLTPREWESLKGLLRGETAKETAQNLDIGYRTVEHHLGKAYLKLEQEFGYKPTRSQIIKNLLKNQQIMIA
tara:strand:- start:1217 stop:2095 length:879 start_codon:yes stop_codon:yes gene_type:complete